MSITSKEQALRYAAAGWPVFPLLPCFKEPLPGSNGFKDATTDPEQISAWWGKNPVRNVGIATGAPGPDVLDIDVKSDGSGFAGLNQCKRAGIIPAHLAIVSTPSGGMHLYFKGTDQRGGSLAKSHIDMRAAGGYVVAPPSVVAGREYEVAEHPGALQEISWQAVRDELEPQAERAPWVAREDGQQQDLSHLVRHVERQAKGNRNNSLYWAGMRAIEAGQPDLIDELAQAAIRAGHPEREARRTARSLWETADKEAAS